MRNSSKELAVFNFEAEEEAEKLSKYQFLQAFASGKHYLKQPDVADLPHVDLVVADSPQKSLSERTVTSTEDKSELDAAVASTTSCHKHPTTCTSSCRSGSPVQDDDLVLGPSSILVASVYEDEETEPQFSEISLNLMSDDEESCDSLSGASSISTDLLETEDRPECLVLENSNSACGDMDEDGSRVTVFPDYVTYGDALFLEPRLTFCSDCIKIECSDASGTDEKLILECGIVNVVRITCQWSRSVEALLIKFWIRIDVSHGVEKLLASIMDVCWLEKEQKIKSLAERYNDIWDTLADDDFMLVDDVFRNRVSFSRRFFTGMVEPFEDVIYPKGDPDAVSIRKRDVELLEPDTFINDTIIDFYIKYLQDKIEPNEKKRFHFFNSFFFRKLADLDKDPGSISEGRAAFQRVRKWTRKVNIFEKDYLFIPVNFNLHWSLLVICHPGEIPTFNDDDLTKSAKVPCILHMDSIKGSHIGLKNLIQSYLLEEWKGRNTVLPDDISSRFLNLRFVPLELPQQENSSDCGLFLLHYVELFLEGAPSCFNPCKITKLSSFLTLDWFPPAEASFKRIYIRGLLYEILRDSSRELTPACINGEFPCSDDDGGKAVQFRSTQSSPSKAVHGSASVTRADHERSVEETETLESSHMMPAIEVHGDDNSSAGQQLVSLSTDEEDRQPSFSSPLSPFCLISYSVDPGEETMDLSTSNERDEIHAKTEEREEESPEKCCSEIELEKLSDSRHACDAAGDEDGDHGLKPLAIDTTGNKTIHEDNEAAPGEPDDHREIDETGRTAAETPARKRGILVKRGEATGSEQVSKRSKAVRFDVGRRITRSSSKESSS